MTDDNIEEMAEQIKKMVENILLKMPISEESLSTENIATVVENFGKWLNCKIEISRLEEIAHCELFSLKQQTSELCEDPGWDKNNPSKLLAQECTKELQEKIVITAAKYWMAVKQLNRKTLESVSAKNGIFEHLH